LPSSRAINEAMKGHASRIRAIVKETKTSPETKSFIINADASESNDSELMLMLATLCSLDGARTNMS